MHYRKIYEQHYGPIPKGYHVHHKDMNHDNDDPLNLEALTPDEHAQKHGFLTNFIMAQSTASERGVAARKKPQILSKMKENMREIGRSNLGKTFSFERLNNHIAAHKGSQKVKEHILRLAASADCRKKRSESNKISVLAREQRRIVAASRKGKKLPSCVCPHCDKVGAGPVMKRYHFDNCERGNILWNNGTSS